MSGALGHRWILRSFGPQGDPSGKDTEWHCYRCETTVKFWKEPERHQRVEKGGKYVTCDEVMVAGVMES